MVIVISVIGNMLRESILVYSRYINNQRFALCGPLRSYSQVFEKLLISLVKFTKDKNNKIFFLLLQFRHDKCFTESLSGRKAIKRNGRIHRETSMIVLLKA